MFPKVFKYNTPTHLFHRMYVLCSHTRDDVTIVNLSDVEKFLIAYKLTIDRYIDAKYIPHTRIFASSSVNFVDNR